MTIAKLQAYQEFLANKVEVTGEQGLAITPTDLHPSLFPHQRDAVQWALKRGKALLAMSFGMGKTRCQIELLRQVHNKTSGKVMVICPLGVRHQFAHYDGPAMGVQFQYVRNDEEAEASTTPFLITNYERVRDGHLSAAWLQANIEAATLDEGAILGNLGTKTQDQFNQILGDIPYRWVATATPAPNDYRQLIYFADFLDAMDQGQALTRFFGRNPDQAGDLQLMPHMERDFWLWVASWALFVNKPSDLGYGDSGYDMPELKIIWHRIAADHEKAWGLTDNNGQHYLLKDTAAGVTQAMREKRDSLQDRVDAAAAIVAGGEPDDHWLIWHDLEDERRAIKKAIPDASEVYGSQDEEKREQTIVDFSDGKLRILATKPQISGSGSNFQHYCHKMIFTGVGFKFRDFIQAVHRLLRYGQTYTVELHIIHTDAEDHVVGILMRKWRQHDEMVERMRQIIQEFGLTNESLASGMRRSLGVTRQERKGQWYTAVHNDCVLEVMGLPDNSVDEIVTSIPFGNHYEYVASLNDFGHNPQDSDFWKQMDFLIPELLRALKPGRMACIHAKDRLLYGHQTPHGMMEVDYFTHDCARAFRKHGFVSYGEIFIPTDVVRENNSTNRLGWSECCKDGSKMGVGLSEKVLLFRKPQTDKTRSYADEPVHKDKPRKWYECLECGHAVNSLAGLEIVMVQEWKDGDEDPVERKVCPKCGSIGKMESRYAGGYSRGRWQIDAHSLWRSNGHALTTPADDPELLTGMDGSQVYNWYRAWSKGAPYDYEQHVAFNEAMGDRLPAKFMLMPPQAPEGYEDVWTDILFFRTLNMTQARRRQEKHLCPLPLDVVERLIVRYSNEGELILDPFGGLHTVPYQAIKLGRRGYGVELNPVYWEAGVRYCEEAEIKRSSPSLFDLMDDDGEAHINNYHAEELAEVAI